MPIMFVGRRRYLLANDLVLVINRNVILVPVIALVVLFSPAAIRVMLLANLYWQIGVFFNAVTLF